jgi:hypothetical protein
MNGKGDRPRPLSVSSDEYEKNWDRIFKTKEKKLEKMRDELQDDINKVKAILDELTQSQEMGLHDTSERNQVDTGVHPKLDDDGSNIEHTPC